MKRKVSVVIPTYKRPKLLIDCLIALSKQTLPKEDFEVIVVSDGPDVETLNYIRPWLESANFTITFLQTSAKNGPAAARNLGWLSSKHPLIAFTDDDCQPQPEWLETFVHHYNDEEFLVFSGHTYVPISDDPTDYELNIGNLQTADFITANCACTYKALVKVHGFDERYKAAWREDSDLEFKFISQNIPIVKIKDAVVVHPVRQAPWGISIKEQKKGIYDALLFKKFPQLYRSKIQTKPLWNYYLINIFWIVLFISAITNNMLIMIIVLGLQLLLLSNFVYKRLKSSKKSLSHILEMLGTSIIIPSLSIFWRIYGSVKFRVVLI